MEWRRFVSVTYLWNDPRTLFGNCLVKELEVCFPRGQWSARIL